MVIGKSMEMNSYQRALRNLEEERTMRRERWNARGRVVYNVADAVVAKPVKFVYNNLVRPVGKAPVVEKIIVDPS